MWTIELKIARLVILFLHFEPIKSAGLIPVIELIKLILSILLKALRFFEFKYIFNNLKIKISQMYNIFI